MELKTEANKLKHKVEDKLHLHASHEGGSGLRQKLEEKSLDFQRVMSKGGGERIIRWINN